MSKAPAFQFYVKDWLSDPQLKMASHSTKGIWADLLCYMWDSPNQGEVIGTHIQIQRMVGATTLDLNTFIEEAKSLKFCDIEEIDNTLNIRNRRMYREAEERVNNRERQKRFREKGGGNPEHWIAKRIEILNRDNHMCAYCGKKANTVDHIIPKSKGGKEDNHNLVACCKSCNWIKNNKSLEECKFTFWNGFDITKLQYNNFITPPSPSPSPTPKNKQAKKHDFILPDWIKSETWDAYREMRQRKRAPLTDRAAILTIKDLENLKRNGNDPEAVLNQSIQKSWTGVFPIKIENIKPVKEYHPEKMPEISDEERKKNLERIKGFTQKLGGVKNELEH